jgi:hypothetical protein
MVAAGELYLVSLVEIPQVLRALRLALVMVVVMRLAAAVKR